MYLLKEWIGIKNARFRQCSQSFRLYLGHPVFNSRSNVFNPAFYTVFFFGFRPSCALKSSWEQLLHVRLEQIRVKLWPWRGNIMRYWRTQARCCRHQRRWAKRKIEISPGSTCPWLYVKLKQPFDRVPPALMSSITFPLGHHSTGSPPSNHDDHSFYPSSSFDDNNSSDFQMNPLSSHPPRTPRASLISDHSYVYGTSVYDSTEKQDEKPYQGDEELDQGNAKVKELERRVRREDIWREMLLTSVGRDKAFVRGSLIIVY